MSACTAKDGTPSDPATGPGATVDRPAFDPPLSFDLNAARPLPAQATAGRMTLGGTISGTLPLALYRTTGYVAATDSLLIVNLDSGVTVSTLRPENPSTLFGGGGFNGSAVRAPRVGRIDGKDLVLAPFGVTIAGQGTTAATHAIELLAVDAASATKAWSFTVPTDAVVTSAWIVGVSGSTVVVGTGAGGTGSEPGKVYAVDTRKKAAVWTRADFTASALIGDMVVGVAGSGPLLLSQDIVGLAVADGKQAWATTETLLGTTVRSAGSVIVATGKTYRDTVEFFRVIDPATGKVLEHGEGRGYSTYVCDFDEKSTVVCAADSGTVYAFDPSAPQTVLWTLPDKTTNRVAPRISTVWHGIVYTKLAFLDIRTGKDKTPNPTVTPVLVNEYIGIALRETPNGPQLVAVPTTG